MSGEVKLSGVKDAIKAAYGSRWSTAFAGHTIDNLKPVTPNIRYQLSPRPGAAVEIATGVVLSIGCFAWCWQRARSGADRRRSRFPESPEWRAMLIVGALVALQFVVALISLPGQWLYIWYADALYATAAVAGGLGLGLVAAAAMARSQPGYRWLAPTLGLALVAVWASTIAPLRSVDRRFDGTRWPGRVGGTNIQYGNVEAAAWLRHARLRGRIGAYDNGWLSFSLDPTPVENLDGLANSYRYFALLQNRRLGLFDVYRVERLRYLATWADLDPGGNRRWARQISSAAVHDETATTCSPPTKAANSASSSVHSVPVVSQPLRNTRVTALMSSSVMSGGANSTGSAASGWPARRLVLSDRPPISSAPIETVRRGPPLPSLPATDCACNLSARCERRALVGHWAHGEHCRRCIVHGDAFFEKLTKCQFGAALELTG